MRETDPLQRQIMLRIAERVTELQLDLNDHLAAKIIQRLSDSMKRG